MATEGEAKGGFARHFPSLVKVVGTLPLVVALLLYFGPRFLSEWEAYFGYGSAPTYDLPPSVMHVFRQYDIDGNGFLDPYEFEMFTRKSTAGESLDFRAGTEFPVFSFEDNYLDIGQEVIVIRAQMTPIVTETMTKFDGDQELYIGSPATLLPGLLEWKKPHEHLHAYGALNFKTFLPPTSDWPVGTPYYIVDQYSDDTQVHMNRYHPQTPSLKHALLHCLLSQFHTNIFLVTRFGPRGTLAVVRAKNEDMLDIVIRVHAEFQLNSEPDYPFWLTPAQFAGRLVVNKTSDHVEYFELFLPTDKQLNVDMEWMTGTDSNEVDIGFIPEMRLTSTQPSFPSEPESEMPVVDVPFDENSIAWDEHIPLDEAKVILERTFYPFKKVTYYSYLTAFQRAVQEDKLVHLVLLWGSLDDQSC